MMKALERAALQPDRLILSSLNQSIIIFDEVSRFHSKGYIRKSQSLIFDKFVSYTLQKRSLMSCVNGQIDEVMKIEISVEVKCE